MHLVRTALPILAFAIAAPASAAVVGGFDDLRLSATLPGKTAKTEVEDSRSGASDTARDAWDEAQRFGIDYVAGWSIPFVGIVAGVGATADIRSSDRSGSQLDYQAWSGHVRLGPYWTLFEIVNLELTGFYGLGVAQLEEKAGGRSASDTGTYMEYGANLDLAVAVPVVGLVAGVGTGWLVAGSEHDIRDQSAGDRAYEITGGNWTATAFLGYRF